MDQGIPNGEKPTNGKADWSDWPSVYQVVKQLGLPMRTVQKLSRDGVLLAVRTPLGQLRIDPKTVEAYLNEKMDGADEQDEAIADRDASRQGIPAEAIRATAELLKAAQAQNLELHKLVIQGFKASHEAQDKTIARLLERVDRTEAVILDLYGAREAYFDSQLERSMVIEREKAAAERRSQMWSVSQQYLGELLVGLKRKWGLDDASAEKLQAAVELLQKLDIDQIETAAKFGFFTAEQIELIEKITGRKLRPEPTTKNEGAADAKAEADAGGADGVHGASAPQAGQHGDTSP